MSKMFALLMQKVNEAKSALISIDEKRIQLRGTLASKGWVEWEKSRSRADRLYMSVDQAIKSLNKCLPVIENNPKYEPAFELQRLIDVKFDIFLKSRILPEFYFKKRGIDLFSMIAQWEKVIMDEYELINLYDHVLPVGAKLGTGKRQKAERETLQKEHDESVKKDIETLRSEINKFLDPVYQAVISSDSKIISLADVSIWQDHWKRKLSELFERHANQSQEELRSALKEFLENVRSSSLIVAKSIIHFEKELSQIDFWLDYISKSTEIEKDRLDPASVLKLTKETKEIRSIFATVPESWIMGTPDISPLKLVDGFLEKNYDAFALIISSVLKAVNWNWFPGYNDDLEMKFLSYGNDHAVKSVVVHSQKSGIYSPKSKK